MLTSGVGPILFENYKRFSECFDKKTFSPAFCINKVYSLLLLLKFQGFKINDKCIFLDKTMLLLYNMVLCDKYENALTLGLLQTFKV